MAVAALVSRITAAAVLALTMGAASAQSATAENDAAEAARGEENEPPPSLREQLTEREDENRLEQPWSTQVAGRPLIIGGQFEIGFDHLDRRELGEGSDPRLRRRRLEAELEAEAFYSFGPQLSLFAQVRLAADQALNSGDERSEHFVERGEMWLHSENIGGSGFALEIGRLDFEDDRLWWWDGDFDAIRIEREFDSADFSLAYAREIAPQRSDLGYIEPEHKGVHRLIFEASWDWHRDHALQLFALRQRDRSERELLGQQVRRAREDESDADLTWIGIRAAGAWDAGRRGLFAYWLDLAQVRGRERVAEFDEVSARDSEVEEVREHRVRGWAFDAGATWVLPWRWQPRFSVGYARGSGDRDEDDGIDRGFQQTGLHGNEVAFGGVRRFDHYGLALDPELSNLSILTVDIGWSLLESSSLDLVYNRYRLEHASGPLRETRIEIETDERDRDLGQAFDVILAIEEGSRLEVEVQASLFRPGAALGDDAGDWVFGALLLVSVAF